MSKPIPLVRRGIALALILLIGVGTAIAADAADSAQPRKVLYFTKSSNFEHSVVKRQNGRPSYSEQVLAQLGPRHGVEFTFSKDGSLFSAEYLAQFDAVMFYTSGDLTSAGKDGNPPLTKDGKAALLDAVHAGLGFIGIHSAADTFHTGETVATNTSQPRTWRYRNLGDAADPYLGMLGGELIVHGTQQIAWNHVVDSKFPGFSNLGPGFEFLEEWYSLTEFAPDLHVLLLLDTGRMRDPHANSTDWPPTGFDTPYQRPPYPSTWARRHGKGRVFYTSLGHREDVWASPLFESILFGGIAWATGAADTDTPPNLDEVAPGARELPPVSGPVPGLPQAARNAPVPKLPLDR